MKQRIIIYSILLGLLTIITGFGLFNLVVNTHYTNNEVSFKVKNEEAYFEATGKYFYGDTTEPSLPVYNAKYLQEYLYQGVDATIPTWEIGNSEFVNDDAHPENNKKVITYVIEIYNRNEERNLNIKLNNVAIQKDAYFITDISYKNFGSEAEADEPRKIFSNNPEAPTNKDLYYRPTENPNAVSITANEVVEYNQKLQITITLTLNTRTKAFTVDNNFSIVLESVAK